MSGRIDIGNVRGIPGERGEKGDRGSTPSYNDLKYRKENDVFVPIDAVEPTRIAYYVDVNGDRCDVDENENWHLLDEEGNATDGMPTPFNLEEYGYLYKAIYVDANGDLINQNKHLIDEEGNELYVESSFISDVASQIYNDEQGFNELVLSVSPHVVDEIVSADPDDPKFERFFDELEGDVKYYLCVDDPQEKIYMEDGELVNECSYKDGDRVVEVEGVPVPVPLEKNTLYFHKNSSIGDDDDVMKYDIYVCLKANTVPVKLVSSKDFSINYNVINSVRIDKESEDDVYLRICTKGDYGQFYNKTDVDNLIATNVTDKLGEANGIATLGSNGRVSEEQLPSGLIEDTQQLTRVIDSKEDIDNKVTILDYNSYSDDYYPSTSAVMDGLSDLEIIINTKEDESNKVTSLDNSDTHYPSSKAVKIVTDEIRTITNGKEDKSHRIDYLDVKDVGNVGYYVSPKALIPLLKILEPLSEISFTPNFRREDANYYKIDGTFTGLLTNVSIVITKKLSNGNTQQSGVVTYGESTFTISSMLISSIKYDATCIITVESIFTGEELFKKKFNAEGEELSL